MATVKKTKVGSEYRVRGPKGKIMGEYNSKTQAKMKAGKMGKKRK